MRKSELDKLSYSVDGVEYTPLYTCEKIVEIVDKEENVIDFELIGFILVQSAQDYYKDRNNIPSAETDKISILNQRTLDLSEQNIDLDFRLLMLELSSLA